MKKVLLFAVLFLSVCFVSAQRYQVKKEKNQLYILHKVEAKESLFSLGRVYGLSHKEIAKANKLSEDAGLKAGQQVKIPLTKSNFIQTSKKSGYQPVYHTIASGDNLYKVSRQYNNVKQDHLKKWNKLSKNVVKPGQELVVGFVKINNVKPADAETMVAATPKQTVDTSKKVANAGPATEKTDKKTQLKADDEEAYVFTSGSEGAEGFFADQFAVNNAGAQPRTITGSAATFKSTSGWSDRKYYILINNVPEGTIVKVNANNKTIYAKVLESLPTLRDNNGLLCRLSNAAASALGITEQKFTVELFYSE